eukprot:1063951-Pelagomonas_calceolata.AAC.2
MEDYADHGISWALLQSSTPKQDQMHGARGTGLSFLKPVGQPRHVLRGNKGGHAFHLDMAGRVFDEELVSLGQLICLELHRSHESKEATVLVSEQFRVSVSALPLHCKPEHHPNLFLASSRKLQPSSWFAYLHRSSTRSLAALLALQGFNKVIEMQRMIDGCDSGMRSLVASIRSTEDLVKMAAKVKPGACER